MWYSLPGTLRWEHPPVSHTMLALGSAKVLCSSRGNVLTACRGPEAAGVNPEWHELCLLHLLKSLTVLVC